MVIVVIKWSTKPDRTHDFRKHWAQEAQVQAC